MPMRRRTQVEKLSYDNKAQTECGCKQNNNNCKKNTKQTHNKQQTGEFGPASMPMRRRTQVEKLSYENKAKTECGCVMTPQNNNNSNNNKKTYTTNNKPWG